MPTVADIIERGQKVKLGKRFPLAFGYEIHRVLSRYITWLFLNMFPNIKPQRISFLMIIVGIIGSLCIATGSLQYSVLGFFIVYISFLLDKVDGEIARFKGMYGVRGVFLDELYHILVPSALFVAVFYSSTLSSQHIELMLFGLVWFVVVNRHVRKATYFIYLKMKNYMDAGSLSLLGPTKWVHSIVNSFPFRITSVTERFDIVLFSLFVLYVFDVYSTVNVLTYGLYVFFFLYLVQFVRYVFLYYFGKMDEEVKRIHEGGY